MKLAGSVTVDCLEVGFPNQSFWDDEGFAESFEHTTDKHSIRLCFTSIWINQLCNVVLKLNRCCAWTGPWTRLKCSMPFSIYAIFLKWCTPLIGNRRASTLHGLAQQLQASSSSKDNPFKCKSTEFDTRAFICALLGLHNCQYNCWNIQADSRVELLWLLSNKWIDQAATKDWQWNDLLGCRPVLRGVLVQTHLSCSIGLTYWQRENFGNGIDLCSG